MELVVHIGTHKAGSSSIQNYGNFRQEALLADAVLYPTGRFARHPKQHNGFVEFLKSGDRTSAADFLTDVRREAEERGATSVLLSAEEFCYLEDAAVAAFAAMADERFATRRFAVIVRNKGDYLLSSYKHALRFAPEPIDELTFVQRYTFSPHAAVARWQANFSPRTGIILFDEHPEDLVAAFFTRLFGHHAVQDFRENVAHDLLTLSISNILLKLESGAPIDQLLWNLSLRFPGATFPLEDVLARRLSEQVPDDYWRIDGLEPHFQALLSHRPKPAAFDTAVLCDKMIALFTELRSSVLPVNKAEGGGSGSG